MSAVPTGNGVTSMEQYLRETLDALDDFALKIAGMRATVVRRLYALRIGSDPESIREADEDEQALREGASTLTREEFQRRYLADPKPR